jgi:hypothetical protein
VLFVALIIARSVGQASGQHKANLFRGEKAAAYQVLINLWQERILHERNSKESPNEWEEELRALDRLLIAYSSPGVMRAHVALRMLERKVGLHHPTVKSQLIRVVIEIRQDVGSDMQGLTVEALEQFLFSDSNKSSPTAETYLYHGLPRHVSLSES